MFNKPRIRDYSSRNNSIEALSFDELADCTLKNFEARITEWIDRYGIKLKSWVYPQVLAHIGKWTPQRNLSGEYLSKETVKHNCRDSWSRGLYWFVMSDQRALVKQYTQTEYCCLVPLILAAFKKFQDVPYQSWSREGLEWAVSPKLLEAMLTTPPEYTLEELLEFRVKGLTQGVNSRDPGRHKSAISTYNLYGLPKEMPDGRVGLASLPVLVRMMLCQTWCCHPQNRNPYMILDPVNWDLVPDPLIETEVVGNQDPDTLTPWGSTTPGRDLAPWD